MNAKVYVVMGNNGPYDPWVMVCENQKDAKDIWYADPDSVAWIETEVIDSTDATNILTVLSGEEN